MNHEPAPFAETTFWVWPVQRVNPNEFQRYKSSADILTALERSCVYKADTRGGSANAREGLRCVSVDS
jgi:hypothetical protein